MPTTAELLDITDLVSGWYRPSADHAGQLDELEPDLSEFAGELSEIPDDLSISEAVAAIDAVLTVFPDARWLADGEHGRIVAGDRLVSLAIPLADPEAEILAWIDAAGRLGNGQQWRAHMWHERASDRTGKGARNAAERVCQSTG